MACPYHTYPFTEQQQTVEKLQPYEYAPLASSRHFRLLKLSRGAANTPIRGNIASADLDDPAVEYVALSYTWGKSAPSHAIECDGRRITVNCNVFSALNRLRRKDADVAWFVDFISINQARDDAWLAERATQVRMMDKIYTKATQVYIDLGEAPEYMDKVVALMTKCCTASPESLASRAQELDELQTPPFTMEVWDAFISLCQRPWFHRIWVLQEYALSKAATIVVGTGCHNPDLVLNSIGRAFTIAAIANVNQSEMTAVRYKLRPANTLAATMQHSKRLHEAGDGLQNAGHVTLGKALKQTLTFDATDPRDRVYGLLGLIDGTDMSAFRIDYKESVRDLSRRLSSFLLYQGAIFDLFYFLCGMSSDGLASWMVDLDRYRRPTGIDRLSLDAADYPYNAGGKGPIQLVFPDDCTSLRLEGVVLDRVRTVSTPFPAEPAENPNSLMENFSQMVQEWDVSTLSWALKVLSGPSHDYQDILRDYRLTVTAGGHRLENYEALQPQELTELLHDVVNDPEPEKRDRARASVSRVWSLMSVFCEGKRIGVTEAGKLCLIPQHATEKDAVVLLRGFPTPFLLRKREDDNYCLLGAAYLCGAMYGESVEMLDHNTEAIEIC